jgi:hypothetical protein
MNLCLHHVHVMPQEKRFLGGRFMLFGLLLGLTAATAAIHGSQLVFTARISARYPSLGLVSP